MRLRMFQVDAFADAVFGGNPAAVCPLDSWLDDDTLQALARENNLSETAFFVPAGAAGAAYALRWFTPAAEVDLCGHATLASAWVVFRHLQRAARSVVFESRSGRLAVTRDEDGGLTMDFPALAAAPVAAPAALAEGLGAAPAAVFADTDYLALFGSAADIRALAPDFATLARLDRRGVIATAPGEDEDFVSRFFCPRLEVPEDPVTGSAHCMLAPFWAARLGKATLRARQVSARGGLLRCVAAGDRVRLTGRAVQYLEGVVTL